MPRVIESMTQCWVGIYRVRVWREETEVREDYNNDDIHRIVHSYFDVSEWNIPKLVEELSKLERINAIEVIHKHTGAGVVWYREWP